MTYREAQRQATLITLRDARGMGREIIREYNLAYDQIKKRLDILYSEIKRLNLTEAQYYNRLQKIGRLRQLSDEIEKDINKYYGRVMQKTRINSINSFVNKYYMEQYAMSWFSGGVTPFAFVNQTAVNVSVYWTNKVWDKIKEEATAANIKKYGAFKPEWGKGPKTLKTLLLKNKQKQLRWIKSSITQGLIQGRSLTGTSDLVFEAFGKSKRNAMRTVRTETMRNLSAGDYLNTLNARDEGVDVYRLWDAVLDGRTRYQSSTMDGQREDAEGYFHYPDGSISQYPGGSGNPAYDINERCQAINIIPGQELDLKRARDPMSGKTSIVTYQKFPDWAKQNDLIYKNGRWIKNK